MANTGRTTMAELAAEMRRVEEGFTTALHGHEALDQERMKNVHGRLNQLFAVAGVGFMILIGVAGWSLNRVYEGQEEQMRLLRSVRADVAGPERP